MWGDIARGRLDLAELLETFDDHEWRSDSLCTGWTVQDVVGHLNFIWNCTDADIMRRVAAHDGDIPAAQLVFARELGTKPRRELIEGLRDNADNRRLPPGARPVDALADVLLHTQDIVIPLGRRHPAPPAPTVALLEEMVGDRRDHYNPRGGITGLSFVAPDVDWSWGEGPRVEGEGIALALALHGRPAPVDRMTGNGVDDFRRRFAA